jgi:hypothetical protein
LPLKKCHVFDTRFETNPLQDDAHRAPSICKRHIYITHSKQWIAAFDYMTADAVLGLLQLINAS